MKEEKKYAQDGVDVDEGDRFSKHAGNLCRETYKNSPYVEVMDFSRGHFRGPRGFRLKGLPKDCWMDASPDGDGTKVVLMDAAGMYEQAAYGWVAMTCGDITRWGGIPLLLVNNLDVESLGKKGELRNTAFYLMLNNLYTIARTEGLVLYKGETAELPGCVTSPNADALIKYLWAGVAIGAYNPKTVITGDNIEAGMSVMALREHGFRNNGISSARKAIVMRYGSLSCSEAKDAVRNAASPAILYDKFLANANGWFNDNFVPSIPVHLLVHLTGGGIKSKFAEDILFPRGLSADLNDLWDPPQIMRDCAEWRGMGDEECYETWNGGQGELAVIDPVSEERFIHWAKHFGIEAKRVGVITKSNTPYVQARSKFTGRTIGWNAK